MNVGATLTISHKGRRVEISQATNEHLRIVTSWPIDDEETTIQLKHGAVFEEEAHLWLAALMMPSAPLLHGSTPSKMRSTSGDVSIDELYADSEGSS